jgi:hypothetical protein
VYHKPPQTRRFVPAECTSMFSGGLKKDRAGSREKGAGDILGQSKACLVNLCKKLPVWILILLKSFDEP